MTARPRILLLALAAMVAAMLALPGAAPARKVGNPGSVTATVTGGLVRIKQTTIPLSDDPSQPRPTFTGTVDAAGNISIPPSGVNFPPVEYDTGSSGVITVRILPVSGFTWTGTLNPLTGSVSLRAKLKVKLEGGPSPGLGGSCYVGTDSNPIDMNTLITGTTSPPGPNTPITGVPYNSSTGRMRLVNNSYSVPGADGCGPFGVANGTVNDALGIPSSAGNNEVQFDLQLSPILTKGVNAAFTPTPSSGVLPLPVSFNASATTAPAGVRQCATPAPSSPSCGYRWDFDGNGSTDAVTNGPATSFTYNSAGTFNARLTVFDADGDSDSTTRTIAVSPPPDVALQKTHFGAFQAGTNGMYTLTARNQGAGPTTGTTTVTDDLPAGLTYVSAAGTGWSCGAAGSLVTCTRSATIAAGQSAPSITLNVAVAEAARPAVTNTASVTTPNEVATQNNGASDPTPVSAIDLAITKAHLGSFRVGRAESYTITVENKGDLPTSGTTEITDVLPQSLSYVSHVAPAGWACSVEGQEFSCARQTAIAPGALEEFTLTVAVDDSAIPVGGNVATVVNTATVTTPLDPDASDDSSSDPTVIVKTPDLEIDKRHTGNFRVSFPGTYTLTVRNVGALPTGGTTTVTDTVPAGLDIEDVSGPGWTCGVSGQNVTCTSSQQLLPDQGAAPISLIVTPDVSAVPSVTNSAHVATSGTGQSADPNPANNTDTDPTAVTAVALTTDKSHAGGFPIGGEAQFTLSVRNAGTAATSGTISVNDHLPAGLTYVSATGAGWACGAAGSDVTCTRGTQLGAGQTASPITLTVNVAETDDESVENTAAVSGPGDINAGNDSDTDTAILTAADIAISISHDGDFTAGTTRAYTLRVRNEGSKATSGPVTVTDTVPQGLTPTQAAGTGWSCQIAGQAVTCTRAAALAGGAQAPSILLSVAVGGDAAPGVTNTANVATAGDRNPANDSASDETTVLAPDLAIQKSHEDSLRAGGTATYDIAVSNVGTAATAAPATVTDVLPTGLSFNEAVGPDWDCSAAGATVTCELSGQVAAGEDAPPLALVVAVGPGAPAEITNTATVSVPEDSSSDNDSADDSATVGRIDLAVDASHAGELVRGAGVTYTLRVSNQGSVPTVAPVRLSDQLPAGMRLVEASGDGWSCGVAGAQVECRHDGPVPADGSAPPLTVEAFVLEDAPTSLVNAATVATRDDANAANNSDTDAATIPPAGPDVALSLRAQVPAGAGFRATEHGNYLLAVRNAGGGATSGQTAMTTTLPAGVTFIAGRGEGWTCGVSGSEVTCIHAAPMAPGSRSDISLEVAVAKAAAPFILLQANVDTPADRDSGNNSASLITGVKVVDVALTLSHGSFRGPGRGSLAVGVRNGGTGETVSPIVVSGTLPSSLTLRSAGGAGWACEADGQRLRCTRAEPLAGGVAAAPLAIAVDAAASARPQIVTTFAVATALDAEPANDAATDVTPVAAPLPPAKTLRISGGTIRVTGKTAKVKVSCLAAAERTCAGTLTLPGLGAPKRFEVALGKTSTVGFVLSPAGLAKLRDAGRLKLTARATLADAAGAAAKARITLVAPSR